jgi:hypothetical protein
MDCLTGNQEVYFVCIISALYIDIVLSTVK